MGLTSAGRSRPRRAGGRCPAQPVAPPGEPAAHGVSRMAAHVSSAHAGHADVHDDEIRRPLRAQPHALAPSWHTRASCPVMVTIVARVSAPHGCLDHSTRRTRGPAGSAPILRRGRQRRAAPPWAGADELAAATGPSLLAPTVTVQLRQPAHQGEPDAQSAWARSTDWSSCAKSPKTSSSREDRCGAMSFTWMLTHRPSVEA